MLSQRLIIVVLLALLVLSNGIWMAYLFDVAITEAYQDTSFQEHRLALTQALAMLPVVADPNATREDVMDAATTGVPYSRTFEKDGFVWVGELGVRFGPDDRLVEIEAGWSPF